MSRQKSMAAIQAALAANTGPALPASSQGASSPLVPGSPGSPISDRISGLKGVTADQKRAYDIERQERLDQKKELLEKETRFKKDLIEREAEFKKQEAAEEAEKSALAQNTQKTLDAAKNIVKDTGVRISGIPTPGGIVFPLVVLLVFFMLLVPVNGHTRATWLWLVLSGNAEVSLTANGGSSAGQETGSGAAKASSSTSTSATTSATTALPALSIPMPLPVFTGVEGMIPL